MAFYQKVFSRDLALASRAQRSASAKERQTWLSSSVPGHPPILPKYPKIDFTWFMDQTQPRDHRTMPSQKIKKNKKNSFDLFLTQSKNTKFTAVDFSKVRLAAPQACGGSLGANQS